MQRSLQLLHQFLHQFLFRALPLALLAGCSEAPADVSDPALTSRASVGGTAAPTSGGAAPRTGSTGAGSQDRGIRSVGSDHTFGPPSADADPAAGLEVLPYLVTLDTRSFTLAWITAEPFPTEVRVDGFGFERTFGDGEPRRFHRVVVDGLAPGRTYRYRVGGLVDARVRTADGSGRFRAVSFGHVAGTTGPGEGRIDPLVHALVGEAADLALICGDVTYWTGYHGFAQNFFEVLRPLLDRIPVVVAPGNHDAGFPMRTPLGMAEAEARDRFGFDFTTFRRMWPYEYGHPTEGGYHTFVRDHVRFVAVAYCNDVKGGFQRQLEWLHRVFEEDTSEFRVVFMGGANGPPRGYDGDALFQLFAHHDVDLVLGGDGKGVFQDEVHGVPRRFLGAQNGPRAYHLLEFDPWSFTLEVVQPTTQEVTFRETFTTRHEKEVVQVLDNGQAQVRKGGSRFVFDGLSVPSSSFDGIELELDWPKGRYRVLELRWSDTDNPRGLEGGDGYLFRERLMRVRGPGPTTFRLRLPTRHPTTGAAYDLGQVMVKVTHAEDAPPIDLEAAVVAVRLVRDAD